MKWLFKLFRSRNQSYSFRELYSDERNSTLKEFDSGCNLYMNHNYEKALIIFDSLLLTNFGKYFPFEMAELYKFRGHCLQVLDFHYEAVENFTSSLSIDPTDCNTYFYRSMSKKYTLDLEGRINDLKMAIEHSKLETELNKQYRLIAKNLGNESHTSIYSFQLFHAQLDLKERKELIEKINNATDHNLKDNIKECWIREILARLVKLKVDIKD
ncbi:MAG: hypothetical protein R2730_11375 [Chitinophagales bacterium]